MFMRSQLAATSVLAAVVGLSIGTCTPVAHAGWELVRLHPAPTPASSQDSLAFGGFATQQAGVLVINNIERAAMWSSSAGSWVDLHTPGHVLSRATCTDGTKQWGLSYPLNNTTPHAAQWSGTAGSFIDFHPVGFSKSAINASRDGQQVGTAFSGAGAGVAVLWTGTPLSFTILHPAGTFASAGHATSGTQQGGELTIMAGARPHPVLWSGMSVPVIDLLPAGASEGIVYGMANPPHPSALNPSQQVGYVTIGPADHAALWKGTAASFVDLHPTGATSSQAFATNGTEQVGFIVDTQGLLRATLWFGQADNRLDLSAIRPAGFTHTQAKSIWKSADGSTVYIAGFGFNAGRNINEALLWIRTPDCGNPCSPDGQQNNCFGKCD